MKENIAVKEVLKLAVERFVDEVPVHNVDYVYLSDWCERNGYKDRAEFYHDAVCDGKSEEELEAEWQVVVDEFYDWCEDNDLIGQEV